MQQETRRRIAGLLVLTTLVAAQPVQAFSFCFSFGSKHKRHAPYSPYPPAVLPPGASYPGMPAAPYAMYPYPSWQYPYPQQPYAVQVPLAPGNEQQ